MSDLQLYTEIASLPDDLKQEIANFVESLKIKSRSNLQITEHKYGYAKGFFKMAADFDEPFQDFNDYRQR